MQVQFAHVCIRVMNLEKSIKFYQKALDLKESRRKDFPEYKFTLVFLKEDKTDFELELTYNYDQEKPYEIGNGYSHLAIYVDNLEGLHKKHKDMGLDPTELKGLPGTPPGYYFLNDPDGYHIEIIRKKY
ncbi:MAG: lactoylglutathione lyase [Desulfitibacter sp. BRH_c19]|nr:MAG: lactoylglutathione lyase [Desulfitibacter sp. BRH_c19]